MLLTEVFLKYRRLSYIRTSSTHPLTYDQMTEQNISSQNPPKKFNIHIYFSSLNDKDGEKKIYFP